MSIERTVSPFQTVDKYQKLPAYKDIKDSSWCPNAGPPSFNIQFPTKTGNKYIVATEMRRCLANTNCHCPKIAFSNPTAFRRCPDNKFVGDDKMSEMEIGE
jgi:hypothetical protein